MRRLKTNGSDCGHGAPRFRLAAVASHVIQYQAPLFRAIAQHPAIDLTVLYCSRWGLEVYRDEQFGQSLHWDVPLLGGYRSEFLPNWSPLQNPTHFSGLINPGLVGTIVRGGFDAVWVHGWSLAANWIAMLAAFAVGTPVLMRGESTLLRQATPWRERLKRIVLSRLLRRTAAALAIGRYNTDFYRAYGVSPERIFLVPYAVNNEFFFTAAAEVAGRKHELKRQLGIPPHLPVALFSGKLLPKKRPGDLLRAIKLLGNSPEIALMFLGDGELRRELEQFAASAGLRNVVFTGFKNQTELARYFGAADIFVLPSDFETWGLVVNEAMCFGLPVIASDQVGATGDLVREGVNGFVYPAGDVPALAQRLATLARDAELRARMGAASRELIEHWSYREDIRGLLDCLRVITGRSADRAAA